MGLGPRWRLAGTAGLGPPLRGRGWSELHRALPGAYSARHAPRAVCQRAHCSVGAAQRQATLPRVPGSVTLMGDGDGNDVTGKWERSPRRRF